MQLTNRCCVRHTYTNRSKQFCCCQVHNRYETLGDCNIHAKAHNNRVVGVRDGSGEGENRMFGNKQLPVDRQRHINCTIFFPSSSLLTKVGNCVPFNVYMCAFNMSMNYEQFHEQFDMCFFAVVVFCFRRQQFSPPKIDFHFVPTANRHMHNGTYIHIHCLFAWMQSTIKLFSWKFNLSSLSRSYCLWGVSARAPFFSLFVFACRVVVVVVVVVLLAFHFLFLSSTSAMLQCVEFGFIPFAGNERTNGIRNIEQNF